MSFRLRVLMLVSLVAVTAVGVTAYIAFTQVSRQVNQSVAADHETVTLIVDELTDYARRHGTWEGVRATVVRLAADTGQRIKLVTASGVVVVDTDTEDGRTARPVPGPPVVADPSPSLVLRAFRPDGPGLPQATVEAIREYRSGTRLAACLTHNRVPVTYSVGANGIPVYQVDAEAAANLPGEVEQCRASANATAADAADQQQVSACRGSLVSTPPSVGPRSTVVPFGEDLAALIDCLKRAFVLRTEAVAPVPLRVFLGATGTPRPSLRPGPVIAAAVLVALLAIASTALLSRRVLRPIGTLTAASERLGEGDLSLRVPARGRDELARLAGSFNRMADSLQRAEERQRRLVADVAHELRTPLANLRGYLEALKDGVILASPELFASLHEEAVLQQRIVDDLQDLALAEAGALAYHRTRVDLAEMLETCRTAHQAAADSAGVTLSVEVAATVVVHADPDRLRQVIGNLVVNALRATPAGGTVRLYAASSGGPATITVRDTARASRRRTCRTSSAGSGGRTPRVAGPPAAVGSGWPSLGRSSPTTAAKSLSTVDSVSVPR